MHWYDVSGNYIKNLHKQHAFKLLKFIIFDVIGSVWMVSFETLPAKQSLV